MFGRNVAPALQLAPTLAVALIAHALVALAWDSGMYRTIDAFNASICGQRELKTDPWPDWPEGVIGWPTGWRRRRRSGTSNGTAAESEGDHGDDDARFGSRMSNGWRTREAELPWVVSIRNNYQKQEVDEHDCLGTIIHNNLILTSSDCIHNSTMESPPTLERRFVIAGQFDAYGENNPWQSRVFHTSRDTLWAPPFPTAQFEYNFGIIRLKKPLEYDRMVKPVCLYDYKNPYWAPRPESCITAGFGAKGEEPGYVRTNLIALPIWWRACGNTKEDLRCWRAVYDKFNGRACAGDEGAPALCWHGPWEGRWFVVGNYLKPINPGRCKFGVPDDMLFTDYHGGFEILKELIRRAVEEKRDD